MLIPNGTYMLVLVIVSFLLCSIGFKKFVWFMSVGYGLSAAGIGATMLIMAFVNGTKPGVVFILQCILFVVYGIRLGGFLLVRELKNEKYRAKAAQVGSTIAPPIFVSIFMWIFCGLIYVCQSAGPVYRLGNTIAGEGALVSDGDVMMIIGFVISAIGVVIEALADKQKSEQKKTAPDMCATQGLYKMCRCPNYFGEMLFWLGVFLSGVTTFSGAGQWIVAIIGFVEIEGVMLSGAKRVETRHIKNYGTKAEYNKYADSTPLLFPLIPLYHVTNPEKIAQEEAAKKAKAEARAKKAGK